MSTIAVIGTTWLLVAACAAGSGPELQATPNQIGGAAQPATSAPPRGAEIQPAQPGEPKVAALPTTQPSGPQAGHGQPATRPAVSPATRSAPPAVSPATRPAVPPAAPPATSATSRAAAQATTSSTGDPVVDDILDRLEAKGEAIKGLACKLTYRYVTVEPVEEEQIKEGELLFARAEPNSRFLIHFSKMFADGLEIKRDEYFAFDGQWLTERNDKARTITKRQIVRPGERVDPFRLGKGPFPLPFGQRREEILQNFKVSLEQFELNDPRNTRHLHCVPLPNTELASRYSRVEIYVDKAIELPVRIVTERLADGNRIEVDFKEINADEAPAMSRFQIEQPTGYTVTEEPLPPAAPDGSAAPGGGR